MSGIEPVGRPSEPPPDRGDAGRSSTEAPAGPARDDQPTVISHRPGTSASPLSDSACRILQGKILPGDRLEHFELAEYIGGGGMGRVFRGVDTRLRRDVALKILSPDQAADGETLLRFQNEAQSAARLDHENIARVYHVGEDRGLHYIAFEFIEGVNIRRLVEQKGPLPLDDAVNYTLQVAEALVHADARNVVHRDIKPSNLLITPQGQVKLIDMGLARLRRLGSSSGDLTQSGVTLGTFDYIAPEQARDPRNADVRSDIYSLGCTFFFMLAGRPPFPEGTMLQKLLQHQADRPPDIRESRPDLPDEAARVLRKMMAKDPRHRHHDPTELVDELRLLAYQLDLRTATRTETTSAEGRWWVFSVLERHLPWAAPIAALLCIVLLIHLLAQRGDPAPPWPDPPPTAQDNQPQPAAPGLEGQSPQPQRPQESPPPGQPASPPVQPPQDLPPDRAGGAAAEAPRSESSAVPAGQPQTPAEVSPPLTDSGEPARPSGSASSSGTPAPSRSGPLIVTDNPQLDGEFSTLQAACSAAVNGDVIELRYNGPREEKPISLANLTLTVRAGKGYQPVVAFRPDQPDPLKYPRSMFTVTAGRLTLVDLAVEMYVPREIAADGWSLFLILGSPRIWLEKCTLSICNASDQLTAYQPDVAFFRTHWLPEADVPSGAQPRAATLPARIDLADCIARGEAAFLCAYDLQPVQLGWQNGLLVTSEQLLRVFGSPQLDAGEEIEVDLRHLTAAAFGGLCRMTQTPDAPGQMFAKFYCANSILISAYNAPLIEQAGIDSPENLQRKISWTGEGNFYENIEVFWIVRSIDQTAPSRPMTFPDWQSYWGAENESSPMLNSVMWKRLPDPYLALHTHVPADYALADSTNAYANPARDAGFQADQLPQHPVPLDPQGL